MRTVNDDRSSWVDLVKNYVFLLGKKKKRYVFLLIFLFIIQFYTVIPPLIIGKIVDFFTNYVYGQSIMPFYFYTALLGLSFSLSAFIRLSLKRRLGNLRSDIKYDLRVRGFERLTNLTLLETRKETAGEKAQKIQNGINALDSLSHLINNEVFHSATAVIGIFIIFLFLKYTYVLFLAGYITGFILIIRYFYAKIQQLNYEYNISIEKSAGSYVEGLSNILTIKSLGAKKSFGTHIASKEDIKRQFEYKIRIYGNGQWIAFQVFNGLCIGTFLFLVGKDVLNSAISLGGIVMFYGYLEKLTGSASQILDVYENLISYKTSISRMMPIFSKNDESDNKGRSFPKNWESMSINKASFDYKSGEEKTGVTGISFNISKGEKIGIVGKSGCGKSTLTKLLLGLYKFDMGHYKIDDVDFYSLRHEGVLKNISLVLQETEMFNLSLKDNITLMRKVNNDLFNKAVDIAQLKEVITKLPEGSNTLIGEKGYHLSGGERQRVGIARAICRNPQILLLDEATSSLDSKTELKIQDALETEFVNHTLIIVAHRVSTLKNVDRIYVMDEGRIVEEGKYDALVRNSDSKFYQIYHLQQKERESVKTVS